VTHSVEAKERKEAALLEIREGTLQESAKPLDLDAEMARLVELDAEVARLNQELTALLLKGVSRSGSPS